MNKFKVFNTQTKKWLNEKDFYINSAGELCKFDRPVICKVLEHVVPVFSTGEKDVNKVELFEGDKCNIGYDFSEEMQETEILESGIIHGNFGDFDIWTVKWALDSDYIIEKTGSKYEEQ